jgi:peroxiredoxin
MALALIVSLGAAAPAAAYEIQVVEGPVIGVPPRDFTLPDTAGRGVRLSEFRGKVILLSFWSCYADTCLPSVGVFEKLLAKLGERGLVTLTVCEDVPPSLAADGYAGLLRGCSAGQTILIDEKREVKAGFRVRQLPTSLVIGPDFTIREIVRGVPPLRDPAFHERLEALVREADALLAPAIGTENPVIDKP